MVISATTYWGLEMNDWPATSVAPAAMQFLEVAGEVTVVAPVALAPAAPSFPAAKTGRKSCTEQQFYGKIFVSEYQDCTQTFCEEKYWNLS